VTASTPDEAAEPDLLDRLQKSLELTPDQASAKIDRFMKAFEGTPTEHAWRVIQAERDALRVEVERARAREQAARPVLDAAEAAADRIAEVATRESEAERLALQLSDDLRAARAALGSAEAEKVVRQDQTETTRTTSAEAVAPAAEPDLLGQLQSSFERAREARRDHA